MYNECGLEDAKEEQLMKQPKNYLGDPVVSSAEPPPKKAHHMRCNEVKSFGKLLTG
jgi:hypothetical protein